MNAQIIKNIEKLEEIEYNSVSSLEQDLQKEEFSQSIKDPNNLVSYYLLADKANPESGSGKKYCLISGKDYSPISEEDETNIDFLKKWANACDGVPLLRQLLTDPYLLVDLRACSEEDCVKHYGLTSHQLITLAENGYLFFNLYEYESDRKESDSKKRFEKHASYPWLEKVINSRFTKITSIRKKAFFDKITASEKAGSFESLVEEGIGLFEKAIHNAYQHKMLNQMADRGVIRDGNPGGLLETAAQHYAYVKSCYLGEQNPAVKTLLKEYLDQLLVANSVKTSTLEYTLLQLRGLKNLIATKYTASMGGVYNMSEGAAKAFMSFEFDKNFETQNGELLKKRQVNRSFIDGASASFLNLLEEVGFTNSEKTSLLVERNIQFGRKAPTEKEFKAYLEFLDRIHDLREMLSDYLHYLSNNPKAKQFGKNPKDLFREMMKAKIEIYKDMIGTFSKMELYNPGFIRTNFEKLDEIDSFSNVISSGAVLDGFFSTAMQMFEDLVPVFTAGGIVIGAMEKAVENGKNFIDSDPRRFLYYFDKNE